MSMSLKHMVLLTTSVSLLPICLLTLVTCLLVCVSYIKLFRSLHNCLGYFILSDSCLGTIFILYWGLNFKAADLTSVCYDS